MEKKSNTQKELLSMIYGEKGLKRCDAWIAWAATQKEDVIVYLSSGHLPFSKEEDQAQTMKKYLYKQLITRCKYKKHLDSYERVTVFNNTHTISIIITKELGWGTMEETFSVAKQIGFETKTEIMVFSSPGHLARITSIWKLFAPKWNVSTMAPAEEMDQKLVALETVKDKQTIIFYWTYFLFGEIGFKALSFIKNFTLNVVVKVHK